MSTKKFRPVVRKKSVTEYNRVFKEENYGS